jgi:hypothetical protein
MQHSCWDGFRDTFWHQNCRFWATTEMSEKGPFMRQRVSVENHLASHIPVTLFNWPIMMPARR